MCRCSDGGWWDDSVAEEDLVAEDDDLRADGCEARWTSGGNGFTSASMQRRRLNFNRIQDDECCQMETKFVNSLLISHVPILSTEINVGQPTHVLTTYPSQLLLIPPG